MVTLAIGSHTFVAYLWGYRYEEKGWGRGRAGNDSQILMALTAEEDADTGTTATQEIQGKSATRCGWARRTSR